MSQVQGEHQLYQFRRLIGIGTELNAPGGSVPGNPDAGNKGEDAEKNGKGYHRLYTLSYRLQSDPGSNEKKDQSHKTKYKLPGYEVKAVGKEKFSEGVGR
jgi:hypothetical protein